MWIELSTFWNVVANLVAIPAIHLGMSWFFTRLPRSVFRPDAWLFAPRAWEGGGRLYERVFAVRAWKDRLPDAAGWFDGFPKRSLLSRDIDYLRDFERETCRGEAAHHAQVLGLLLTVLWNPWPVAALVMVVYAFLSNLPCIIVQRHTRLRLAPIIAVFEEAEPARSGSRPS